GYRQRQRRREQALHQRLAADLHDDVGGLLTQISIDSALLHTGSSAPEQQKRLERIAEASRQAVRQMSDVVWSIDAQHGSWADVLERMRDHAYEVLSPAGIEIDFAVAPAATALAVGLHPTQQLYLIYKEALHNVVKHSGARRVTVRLNHLANHLEMNVRDDGRGHAGGSPLGGRGLNNMLTRAEAVGGTVKYDFGRTEIGFGLLVRLPLR
ncbi:MAG: hypothetical protein H7Z21_15605, partial [Hymenobacter sp.]|nr:hypothetical protein [Hymenobacter sp.]